jgi:hypothetical protein
MSRGGKLIPKISKKGLDNFDRLLSELIRGGVKAEYNISVLHLRNSHPIK